jgi:hypothetical protein
MNRIIFIISISILTGCNVIDPIDGNRYFAELIPCRINIDDRLSFDFIYDSTYRIDSIISKQIGNEYFSFESCVFKYEENISQIVLNYPIRERNKTITLEYEEDLVKCIYDKNGTNEIIHIKIDKSGNPMKIIYNNNNYDLITTDSKGNITKIEKYTSTGNLFNFTSYLYDNETALLNNADFPKWLTLICEDDFFSFFLFHTNNCIKAVGIDSVLFENNVFYQKKYPQIIHVNRNDFIHQISINYKLTNV